MFVFERINVGKTSTVVNKTNIETKTNSRRDKR